MHLINQIENSYLEHLAQIIIQILRLSMGILISLTLKVELRKL